MSENTRSRSAEDVKEALSRVLWIGGATDAGKTSIAQTIADYYRLPVYHYDRHDAAHHERLLEAGVNRFMAMSLEERWLKPDPPELLQHCVRSFADRFPLAIEDLLALPEGDVVLAEGYGLTPDLIAPYLTDPRKAVFLFPTATFKYESMERRRKLAVLGEQAAAARGKLFIRDMLLADRLKAQAQQRGFTVIEVDGTESIEQMAHRVEERFQPFLPPADADVDADADADDPGRPASVD